MLKANREDPVPSQNDAQGVPWRRLKEYGYEIEHFPPELDCTRPELWTKAQMIQMWQERVKFKFVRAPSVSHADVGPSLLQAPTSSRGVSLPIIPPSAPVVAHQRPRLEDELRLIYDEAPDTYLKFRKRLERDHPSKLREVTDKKLGAFVRSWRAGIRGKSQASIEEAE